MSKKRNGPFCVQVKIDRFCSLLSTMHLVTTCNYFLISEIIQNTVTTERLLLYFSQVIIGLLTSFHNGIFFYIMLLRSKLHRTLCIITTGLGIVWCYIFNIHTQYSAYQISLLLQLKKDLSDKQTDMKSIDLINRMASYMIHCPTRWRNHYNFSYHVYCVLLPQFYIISPQFYNICNSFSIL